MGICTQVEDVENILLMNNMFSSTVLLFFVLLECVGFCAIGLTD